jgi:hypothetical protein
MDSDDNQSSKILQTTTYCWVSPTFPNHVTCHFRTSGPRYGSLFPATGRILHVQNSGWQSNAKIMQTLCENSMQIPANAASMPSRIIGPTHAAPIQLRLSSEKSCQSKATEHQRCFANSKRLASNGRSVQGQVMCEPN